MTHDSLILDTKEDEDGTWHVVVFSRTGVRLLVLDANDAMELSERMIARGLTDLGDELLWFSHLARIRNRSNSRGEEAGSGLPLNNGLESGGNYQS